MVPQRRKHRPPPWLHCPFQGCGKELQSKSGLTRHIQARHRDLQSADLQLRTEPCPLSSVELDDHLSAPPSDDLEIPDTQRLSDFHDAGDWETFGFTVGSTERYSLPPTSSCRTSPLPYDEDLSQRGFTEYHPLIDGTSWTFHLYEALTSVLGQPCDSDGGPLDPGSPLRAAEAKGATDWTPYSSRVAFELADFIYRRNQMSAGDFNALCELWKATHLPHDGTSPFSNYAELCRTIDATPVGGVAWESITLSYTGPRPDDTPSWMESTHELWYRDPRLIFKGMLENPEFQDFFDYAPVRRYDARGDREYENLMSGNWAWKQAVSILSFAVRSY